MLGRNIQINIRLHLNYLFGRGYSKEKSSNCPRQEIVWKGEREKKFRWKRKNTIINHGIVTDEKQKNGIEKERRMLSAIFQLSSNPSIILIENDIYDKVVN